MILRLFDYSTAILILLCLTLKFKHRWTWALYMYGCFVYTFINFYRDLPGQAIMNLIAGLIALKNIITYKKDINLMKPVLQAIVIDRKSVV